MTLILYTNPEVTGLLEMVERIAVEDGAREVVVDCKDTYDRLTSYTKDNHLYGLSVMLEEDISMGYMMLSNHNKGIMCITKMQNYINPTYKQVVSRYGTQYYEVV